MSLSGLLRFGTNRPIWVGTAVDKFFVFTIPLAYAIVTVPLLLWAFITFIVSELVAITANIYNWAVVTFVMVILFIIFLLYEPLFSLVIQILAPFIQILIFIICIWANIWLVIIRVFIDIWNTVVPLLVVFVVYLVDLLVVFMELVASLITEMDLTGFVYDILEVMWVFVDIALDGLNIAFSLAPTVLVYVSQVVGLVLVILLESVFLLVPHLTWVIEILPPVLIPILDAVVALVDVFSSMIAGGAGATFAARSLLSVDGGFSARGASSSRFDDGIMNYFQTMHTSSRGQPTQQWLDETRNLVKLSSKKLHITVRPLRHATGSTVLSGHSAGSDAYRKQYSRNLDPEEADSISPEQKVDESFGYDTDVDTLFRRRSLAARFRRAGSPFYHAAVHQAENADLVITDPVSGRRVLNNRSPMMGAVEEQIMMLQPQSMMAGAKRSLDGSLFSAMQKRVRRGSAVATALSRSAHSVMDTMAPVEDHVYAIQSSLTGLAVKHGFSGVMHAVRHYKTRNPTSWHFIARNAPDVTTIPLIGQWARAEHEADPHHIRRSWWHQWHRERRPVRGFRDDSALNRALEKMRAGVSDPDDDNLGSADLPEPPEDGEINPKVLPIASTADCYTTDPRSMFCLPQIPYSWRIPLVEFDFPTELSRDCPGFIAPPNILVDGSVKVFHWFNPWVIFYNTLIWIRTLLSLFVSFFFLFDAIAVRFEPLRFLTILLLSADPREGGVDIKKILCLILFAYYPLAFAYAFYTIGIVWPPVSRLFLKAYAALSASARAYNRSTGNYQQWLSEPDPLAFPTRFYSRGQVAGKYFLQNSPYTAQTRTVRPYPIYNQVIRRGVFADGEQWDEHSASAGIDEPLRIDQSDDQLKRAADVERVVQMQSLSDIAGVDIEHMMRAHAQPMYQTHEALLVSMVMSSRTQLQDAYDRCERNCGQLHSLVHQMHHNGVIDGSIADSRRENIHRVSTFAHMNYMHGHVMTPAWISHMADSLAYQNGHSGYKEDTWVAL